MDVEINKTEWESLPEAEREKIQTIVGSHFPSTTIVGDPAMPSAKALIENRTVQAFSLSKPFCAAACGVAEAAAVSACSALSGGIGVAVCVAAAHAAGDFCRSKC